MSATVTPTRLGHAFAVLAVCGALAACGGSSEPPDSSPDGDQDAARVRLTQCLREQGVDVPDNPGAGDVAAIDRDKLREAMNGPCSRYQSEAFGNLSDEDRQELQDRFQKFAQCMRDNGVDVPDITSGGGRIDQDDPDVQAASERCQSALPQGAPGGGQ
jgi:hypothetical protein